MLALCAFAPGTRGHTAQPGAVIRLHDVRLVTVTFGKDFPSVANVTWIRGGGMSGCLPALLFEALR